MVKRKREDDDHGGARKGPPSGAVPSLQRQQAMVGAKIEFGVKSLKKALKVSAGFERQKFSRRRKQAQAKGDESLSNRIEAEWKFLKSIDYDAVAEHHLYKTLSKIKSVASSPAFSSSPNAMRAVTSDPAGHNVLARLYKAAPTHNAITPIIDDITKTISAFAHKASGAGETEDVAEEKEGNESASDMASQDIDMMANALGNGSEESDSGSWNGFSDAEGEEDNSSKQKGTRVMSSRGLSVSVSPEPEEPEEPEGPEGPAEPVLNAPPKKRPTESTFLPALTMGGYWSGSESEPEDDIDVAPRKNRRGQRARQQLWEKKYGSKAKHLQKPAAKDDRNKDWDPKRGARSAEDDRRGGRKPFGLSRGRPVNGAAGHKPGQTDAGPAPPSKPKPTHRDDDGKLHPSWEAAKKAKEAKQTASFAGKKITFD